MVTYMKDFGEQAYFVNIPSKFISADGKTLWLCLLGEFCDGWNGDATKVQSARRRLRAVPVRNTSACARRVSARKANRIRYWPRRMSPDRRRSKCRRAFRVIVAKARRTAWWADSRRTTPRNGRPTPKRPAHGSSSIGTSRKRSTGSGSSTGRTHSIRSPAGLWSSAMVARSSSKNRCPTPP